MENEKYFDVYKSLAKVPKDALTEIESGRLAGKHNVNPQWRIERMTEQFGQCGVGWKYEILHKWIEEGSEGQKVAFVDINLYTRVESIGMMGTHLEWSDPIPGSGGSMFVANERRGPYTSDEAFKMATTDALGVAMKFLGIGADVYRGVSDQAPPDDKYDHSAPQPGEPEKKKEKITPQKPWLTEKTRTEDGKDAYKAALHWVKNGGSIDDVKKRYRMTKKVEEYFKSVKPE